MRKPPAQAIRRAARRGNNRFIRATAEGHRREFFTLTCHACDWSVWVDGTAEAANIACLRCNRREQGQ